MDVVAGVLQRFCRSVKARRSPKGKVCVRVGASSSIETVIGGSQGNIAAGNINKYGLQALVALGDLNGTASNREGIIGMKPIIAGGKVKSAVSDTDNVPAQWRAHPCSPG